MQKMITKWIERMTPRLYETDGQGRRAVAYAHYFSCVTNWDWYMTEYDPETKEAFGYVDGICGELGYFSIAEFEETNKKFGREVIERDMGWEPAPLSSVMHAA